MNFTWKNGTPKVAFVTGGGSGLGRQFAKLLIGEGASVALFDLRIADEVLAEMRGLARGSQKVMVFPVDMTDAVAVESAVAGAVAALGAPDFAINCAGIAINAPFEKLSREAA